MLLRRQGPKEIDIGFQICLPAPPTIHDGSDHGVQRVLIHNLDTPTFSSLSLCMPAAALSDTEHVCLHETLEKIDTQMSIKFLVGTLNSLDLRLNRATVDVHLVAKSAGGITVPEIIPSDLFGESEFYKNRLQSSNLVFHREKYNVPISRITLVPNRYLLEDENLRSYRENIFLVPSTVNEALFTVTNPFTRQSMDVVRNPLLDVSSRASLQSREAMLHSSRINLHGINNNTSPYHERRLMNASRVLTATNSQVEMTSETTSTLHELSIGCSQDKTLGSIMEDFTLQRATIERRARHTFHSALTSRKQCRASSLPQKLSNIPILTETECSVDELFSAKDVVESELSGALTNDFIKSIIPEPQENFYTICSWDISKADKSYDVTMDTGYLQHSVFFKTLKRINSLAQAMDISPERLRQLQLDYLHEYKLHLTAVYNRHIAGLQEVSFSSFPQTDDDCSTITEARSMQIANQLNILDLLRYAPISLCAQYSDSSLIRVIDELDASNNLDQFSSTLGAHYQFAIKSISTRQLSVAAYFKAIAALRSCITWGCIYRSTTLPALQDICSRTGKLVRHFFGSEFSIIASMLQKLLLQLKGELDGLSNLQLQCIRDCNPEDDAFLARLGNICPEDWEFMSELARTYMRNAVYVRAYNYNKVLAKLTLAADLIIKILSRERTDQFLCVKSLLFLYWRSIVPFQLTIIAGECYYRTISYLINLEFQKRYYSEENYGLDVHHREEAISRAKSRAATGQAVGNLIPTSRLARQLLLPVPRPTDSYDEYVDSCMRHQYMAIPYLQALDDSTFPVECGAICIKDVFGLISREDYHKVSYNLSRIGLRRQLRVALSCPLQTLPNMFLSTARHLSAAMYPFLLDFASLFTTTLITNTDISDQRHLLERKAIRRLKRERKTLATKVRCDEKDLLNLSSLSSSSDDFKYEHESDLTDLEDASLCLKAPRGDVYVKANDNSPHNSLMFPSAARVILHRFYHLGFSSSNPDFQKTLYRVTLNLTLQFTRHLHCCNSNHDPLKTTSVYNYYSQSMQQLDDSICKLRSQREDAQKRRQKVVALARERDNDQLARTKPLTIDDLYLTAKADNAQLYASLAVLDADYAERLKSVKIPLDYELQQVIWKMNDASRIFSEEDFKLARHSIQLQSTTEYKRSEGPVGLPDDLEHLIEKNRLGNLCLSLDLGVCNRAPTVIYSQPHSLENVTDPALISDLVSSLLISYTPQVECSLVPLWNLALDLSTIFFTLPIMVSLYFGYFFPSSCNSKIQLKNPAVPNEATDVLSLSLIDFYSDTSQNDLAPHKVSCTSRPSSTRRSARSAGKLIATESQLDALKHFHNMGIFSSSNLEGEAIDFLRLWNTLTEWSSLSTLLSTQEQLILPSSDAFKDTILAGTSLQKIYLDRSPFSLITGTAFESFGYCSFLNITDYNILDRCTINERFESIASTARLVIDTVTAEHMAGSCYSAIQSALTASSMKKLYTYVSTYGKGVTNIPLYDPDTVLYSELGGFHMWRAPAFTQGQADSAFSSSPLLSARDFLSIEESGLFHGSTDYSILHPQFYKIIPQLDFPAIDSVLDSLSLYDNGFHVLPTNLYQTVFAISLREFKKSMASLLTYYRYLFLYVHYASLVLVTRTLSLELDNLEKDLQRPIDSPDSLLVQQELMKRLAKIELSELYAYLYKLSIAQYEDLCTRFPDTRSVFTVVDLESSAFSLLQRILCLKEQRVLAAALLEQRHKRFLELTTVTEEWLGAVSGMLLDHITSISSLFISDAECYEKIPLYLNNEPSALLRKLTMPPIYRTKTIDALPVDHDADLAFFSSIFSATSLLALPPPDLDMPVLLQSICSEDTMLRSVVMNDKVIPYQADPSLPCQLQDNMSTGQPSLSRFLSMLYYISTELRSLETVLEKWRIALVSDSELLQARPLIDSAPLLHDLHFCLQIFYTISVYPMLLNGVLQDARSWGLSRLSSLIPRLYSVLDSTLNAAQVLSLWTQSLADNPQSVTKIHVDSFVRENALFQGCRLCQAQCGPFRGGFSILARDGSVLTHIVPSGWKGYLSSTQSSLQTVANDIVCLDLLCTPSFTSFHKKAIQSFLRTSDSSSVGDILTAIRDAPCASEFLAYLCLNAQADSRATAELEEAEKLLGEIVISAIGHVQLESPPKYTNQRSQTSYDGDLSKCLIPLICFFPKNVFAHVSKCESILAYVASRSRPSQTRVPTEEVGTLKGAILSRLQSSDCLPLPLLPYSNLLIPTTYSDTVHRRIKDFRAALNATLLLYRNLLYIPRLFWYALTMYGNASFVEASVVSRGIRSMAENPTLLYSVSVFTMHEATTLFNMYGQYSSLVNSKLSTTTPLVHYASNISICKLTGSILKDLETIVHRLVTTPHLSLFSKVLSSNQQLPHTSRELTQHSTSLLAEYQPTFSPTVSLDGHDTLQLKHLVPYLNGSHHFMSVLFPLWAPASHAFISNIIKLPIYAQWVQSYVPLNITNLIAPSFPNKRHQLTELISHSETLCLVQPVKCPAQLYSLPDTLFKPVSSALLQCTSQALGELLRIAAAMDELPLQQASELLSFAYSVSVPLCKSDLAFELHTIVNSVVTAINSFVYDSLRVAISTILKMLLEQQLRCVTPKDFLENYGHLKPVLQRSYLFLHILLLALKVRTGAVEQCRDPLVLMSNRACKEFASIKHDTTYRDALYIWAIEQYMMLLMLEHDLWVELRKEQTRDKVATTHLLSAISEDRTLAHTHATYLSTNKTFEFIGAHMEEYLRCTIYPMIFLQFGATESGSSSVTIAISNDVAIFETSTQWLGVPQKEDLCCVFPPQLQMSILRVLESFTHTNTVFLLLDKIPQLDCCSLPRVILHRFSRLMMHQAITLLMTQTTFESDLIRVMTCLAAGLLVGIIGFEFLQPKQQATMIHLLEELRYPDSSIPGLAVVSPTSKKTQAAMEALEFGKKWSSMTIDDQGNFLSSHITLRDARVSDVLARPHGMGKVIIFMHCLLPVELDNVRPNVASSSLCIAHENSAPLIDQYVCSVFVDKSTQSILDTIYSPEIVYFSLCNAHNIIAHSSMDAISKFLDARWVTLLDHSSALANTSLHLAQVGVLIMSKVDESLIFSRSASNSPICIAFSTLHYLLTRISADYNDTASLRDVLYLIKAILVASFALSGPDSDILTGAIEAFLSLQANSLSDSLFYKYTVQFFYPFFNPHYKNRLSFLMLNYRQSFMFVYTATTISEMLAVSTAPTLVVSCSHEFVREVAQLACHLRRLIPIYTDDHTEVKRLLSYRGDSSVQNLIVYRALTLSALHFASSAIFNSSNTTSVLVVVSNVFYQKHLAELNYMYGKQFIVPIVPRCVPREVELLMSPIPFRRKTYESLAYSITHSLLGADQDAVFMHPSLLLKPSSRGIDIQKEVDQLLSSHGPSFIVPLPALSHITSKWVAARSTHSFARVSNYIVQRLYHLFFRHIFPFCLQGVAEIVRGEFVFIFEGEHKLLTNAPTKVLTTLIWYNLIQFRLLQHDDCSSNRDSLATLNDDKIHPDDIRAFPFHFSPDDYEAYLSGELTAFHRVSNAPNPLTYADLPDALELDLGSIPSQPELLSSFVHAIQQTSSRTGTSSFAFCDTTIQALFHVSSNAISGLVRLLVFIFFAAWNAYSLVYLTSKAPDLHQPEALLELGQKLRLSMKQLLTLFSLDPDSLHADTNPSGTKRYTLSGYILAAVRIAILLDVWKKGVSAPVDTISYEQREQCLLLDEYVARVVDGQDFSLQDPVWDAIDITISECVLVFTSATSTLHSILQDLMHKFTLSPNPTLSEVFSYVVPSLEDSGSGDSHITLSYLSYTIGSGFLSPLSCASQAQILDKLLLEGALLYELKKAEIKERYRRLCLDNAGDDRAGHQANMLHLRDNLTLSAMAYSHGLGSSSQTSIQKPLCSTLFIDEPRAALVVLIAACAISAAVYPSGISLEIYGERSVGKTSLIEVAELLVQDIMGPWIRLTEALSDSEIFELFHACCNVYGSVDLIPSKLSRWSASILHVPNTWEHAALTSLLSQLSLLSISLPPRQRLYGNRFHIVGELSVMNTTVIIEKPYHARSSTCFQNENIDGLTISLPKLTLEYVLSLLRSAFSFNKGICHGIMTQALSFLFSGHAYLFSNYSFLSNLQRHLFWLPLLDCSPFLEDESRIAEDVCEHRTIYSIIAALRDVPSMSNANLASILAELLSVLNVHALDISKLKALAPQWHTGVSEAYSNLGGREDLRMLVQNQDHVLQETTDRSKDDIRVESSQSGNADATQAARSKELATELHNLRLFYRTCNATTIGISDRLYYSLNAFLKHANQGGADLINLIGPFTYKGDDKRKGPVDILSSGAYSWCKANPLNILLACGCVHTNLEWLRRLPRYFELSTTDLYLEHLAYDRQLAEAKTRYISPPDNPRYVSPSLALQFFEIYAEAQALNEHNAKLISCLREYLLSPLPPLCSNSNLYACLWSLFLWNALLSSAKISRQMIRSLHDCSTEYLKRHIDIYKKIRGHTISESLFDDTTESIIDKLLLLRDDVPLLSSSGPTEKASIADKESPQSSILRASLDLKLSDLRETLNLQATLTPDSLLHNYSSDQSSTVSLLPVSLSTSNIAIPCYRLFTPAAGHKQFQQISYLIQTLGGYTPFLDLKFEHLCFNDCSTDSTTFTATPDQLLSSRTGVNTPVHGDSANDYRDQQHKRILIDIDTILMSVSHVSAGEKEKGTDKSSHHSARDFVRSLSIAVLELSTHLPDFDSDFLATLMLLRTAVCLAAGVNPIYFLYTISHTIIHSSNQFGPLASLAQGLLRTPTTRYFDSGVSTGASLVNMYTNEPLLNTHLPSVLSVPGHLENYVMHTFSKDNTAVFEFTHRFEQGGGLKNLSEQKAVLMKKYLIEPSYVAVLATMDTLVSAATGWPTLNCFLHTTISPGNLVKALFTSEELSIILTAVSLNSGLGKHLQAGELHSILASSLMVYVLHGGSDSCVTTATDASEANYFGVQRLSRSPDNLFDGSLATFFSALSQSPSRTIKIDLPTVHTLALNPLFPAPKYTAEQMLIYCKVNGCQLSRTANLPEQLKINWEAHRLAVLLTCFSLHKTCSCFSPKWHVPLQSYIKLTVDIIGMIFSRAQQYYANINSINNLFKVYTCITRHSPPNGLKTHDSFYPEIYSAFFNSTQESVLPIESISLKYLQYFVGNLVSQDDKVFGELCYMRSCLYSFLETCKAYSKLVASILGQLCYEAPILVACMLYGVTGLLDTAVDGDVTSVLDVLVGALQRDGLPVILPGSNHHSQMSSLPSKGMKLFPVWTKRDMQHSNLFLKHFQISLCLDTPIFMAELVFRDVFSDHENYRLLLYAGVTFALLGRRIFLTYNTLASPLVFTLVASVRPFEVPFCRLYEILLEASEMLDPIQFIRSKNQAFHTYIHQVSQRKVELSVCQPYRQFCASIAKALAESDRAIIFTDVGARNVPHNNYSILRKLFLLAATSRVDARQQINLGSQVTYLYQSLSEYIFIIGLSPEYDASFLPVPILHVLAQAGMNRENMLASIIFLCNLSPDPKHNCTLAERAAIVDTLTRSVFGLEFTNLSMIHRRNTMLAKLSLSLTDFVDAFHSYLLEYGVGVLPIDESFRSEKTIMTIAAYTQRRAQIEALLSDFSNTYSVDSGDLQSKLHDYRRLTCANGSGKKVISSVSVLLDILREVCLLFYALVPTTGRTIPLMDLHVRRSYSIGDEISHFSVSQSVNILNELQTGYLLRSRWYTQIESCAELAWDLLQYLRAQAAKDPAILMETSKAMLTTFQKTVCNQLASFYTTTVKTVLKRFFSSHLPIEHTDMAHSIDKQNTSQDSTGQSSAASSQVNILADLITFRYDSLRYPIFYYMILQPRMLMDFICRQILGYALSRISASALPHLQAHKLFLMLSALSNLESLEEERYSDESAISKEALEASILEDNLHFLLDVVSRHENNPTSGISIELLACLYPQAPEEMSSLICNCLLSSQAPPHSTNVSDSSASSDLDAIIPSQFSISKEAKQLFLSCVVLSRFSKGTIELLPHLTENPAAILVCTQYPCLLVTALSLYLADDAARSMLEHLLDRNASVAREKCIALEQRVVSLTDSELEKDKKHLNLSYLPQFLQRPTTKGLYLAFLLSVLLRPESFPTASALLLQLWGQYAIPSSHVAGPSGPPSIFLLDQCAQRLPLPATLQEEAHCASLTSFFCTSDGTEMLSQSCISNSFSSLLHAAQIMAGSASSLLSQRCELVLTCKGHVTKHPLPSSQDSHTSMSPAEEMEGVIKQCRYHLPLTMVFCEGELFSVDDLLAMSQLKYGDEMRCSLGDVPTAYQFPSSWTDFHRHSIVCILSNHVRLADDLERIVHLVNMRQQLNINGIPAFPVWLIIPQHTMRRAISAVGERLVHALEYLVYFVRPIILRYTGPVAPSDLYKTALTHYFLQHKTRRTLTIDQLDLLVAGLLHACIHKMPQITARSGPRIHRYLGFVFTMQHSTTHLSSSTLLFARGLNALLFLYSGDPYYSSNDQFKHMVQECFDYYITLKALKIKGNLSLCRCTSVLTTKVHRPQAHHRWGKSTIRLTEKEKGPLVSDKDVVEGVYPKKWQSNSVTDHNTKEKLWPEDTTRLAKDVIALAYPDRVVDDSSSPTITFELPSHTLADCSTGSVVLSVFDRILKALVTKEQDLSLNSPLFNELAEFRRIINANMRAMVDCVQQLSQTKDNPLTQELHHRNPPLNTFICSMKSSLIQMLSAPAHRIEKGLWRISSVQKENDLRSLLILLKLSLVLHKNVSAEKVCLLAFLNSPPERLFLTKSGTLTFANVDICEDSTELCCFPVHIQIADLTFSEGAYDFSIPSLVSSTAEQEQGYASNISICVTATALPSTFTQSTIQLPADYIPISIQLGHLPLLWLILPQSENVQTESPPVINIVDT